MSIIILTISMVIVTTIGGIATQHFASQDQLEGLKLEQMRYISKSKARQIESYFRQIRSQAETLAEDPTIIAAMSELSDAFHLVAMDDATKERFTDHLSSHYRDQLFTALSENMGTVPSLGDYLPTTDAAINWQYHYISNNEHGIMPDKLDRADDGSSYSERHAVYHPIIRNFLEKFGYYDIFLIDLHGDIVYTVKKEVDFATNLHLGPYEGTNLGRLFRDVALMVDRDAGGVKLIDFDFYAPSNLEPASFIASPIYEGNTKIGILAFQMPIDRIESIMTGDENWYEEGLGLTGEAILVGDDYLMRSRSRLFIQHEQEFLARIEDDALADRIRQLKTTILLNPIRTAASRQALAGMEGTDKLTDYAGREVLTAFQLLDISDVKWAIITKIDTMELQDTLAAIHDKAIISGVLLAVVMLPLVTWIAGLLSLPLSRVDALSRAALGGDARTEGAMGDAKGVPESFVRLLDAHRKGEQGCLELLEFQRRHWSEKVHSASERIRSIHEDIVTVEAGLDSGLQTCRALTEAGPAAPVRGTTGQRWAARLREDLDELERRHMAYVRLAGLLGELDEHVRQAAAADRASTGRADGEAPGRPLAERHQLEQLVAMASRLFRDNLDTSFELLDRCKQDLIDARSDIETSDKVMREDLGRLLEAMSTVSHQLRGLHELRERSLECAEQMAEVDRSLVESLHLLEALLGPPARGDEPPQPH